MAENNNGAPDEGSGNQNPGQGAGNQPRSDSSAGGGQNPPNNQPNNVTLESLPAEHRETAQKLIDQAASAARKSAESATSRKARERREQEEAEREENELREQGKFKELAEAEQKKREKADRDRKDAERRALSIEVAVEKKLPNPLVAAKRLVGQTREELEADADDLLTILKADGEKDKKKQPATPPATPEGGGGVPPNTPEPDGQNLTDYEKKKAAYSTASRYNI